MSEIVTNLSLYLFHITVIFVFILALCTAIHCRVIHLKFNVWKLFSDNSAGKGTTDSSLFQCDHSVAHLAIVMDGNRRFAKQTSRHTQDSTLISSVCSKILSQPYEMLLPPNNKAVVEQLTMLKKMIRWTPLDGHRLGAEKLEDVVLYAIDAGVQMLTVYAFSVENWNRAVHEVNMLLVILIEVVYRFNVFCEKHGVFIRFIVTDSRKIPSAIYDLMKMVENRSRNVHPRRIVLNVCMSYSGQTEIANACTEIAQSRRKDSNYSPVTVEEIRHYMLRSITQHQNELLDKNIFSNISVEPQLMIRTGGDYRISNFLLFESAYSEFFFSARKWPEFSKKDFCQALTEFSRREKRLGR